ncbi:hypothetical protein MWU54_07830 [Marivita sp. S6314]|uniref:hypothetical protein n=1 Tax=Marivita sp. S6314 TaxID=2926406 RepID=UPI001FF1D845|nr:hypothetical protein [Marivita sp. S6314]MCK0149926.1 hypothetical protein [Marivita sp. S6314]
MALIWHLRVFVGLGAIFAALSELWFYPIADLQGLPVLVVFYAIAAHAAFLSVARLGGGGALGAYLAAVLLGFAIEGIPVFELYSALPFTLIWTSMAWHGVVSGLIGLWLYRYFWARGVPSFVVMNLCLGAFLGLWGAYFWGSDQDGPRFFDQVPFAFALFAGGHLILANAQLPKPTGDLIMWGMVGIVVVGFGAGALWVMFPMSLVLPLACAITVIAVLGARSAQSMWARVPWRRSWVMLLMPGAAAAVFAASSGAVWVTELNAYVILIFGPVSVGLLLWCLGRALSARLSTSGQPPGRGGA